MNLVRKEWASKPAILEEVADVPDNWLRGFAVRHPMDCRKFHAARNGAMLYRVEAVLKAIEDGESMPDEGIVHRESVGTADAVPSAKCLVPGAVGAADAELAPRAQDRTATSASAADGASGHRALPSDDARGGGK